MTCCVSGSRIYFFISGVGAKRFYNFGIKLGLKIMCDYFNIVSSKNSASADTSSSAENTEAQKMQALWRSVITQALIDAASNSKKKIDKLNRVRAIQWLKGDSEDFFEVCILSDMDPSYVKHKAQQALQRGCKWRNDLRVIMPISIEHDVPQVTEAIAHPPRCDCAMHNLHGEIVVN
jgi:hypothetical protein